MKLSVIVPIYNAEKYLSRCLDSLLNQGMQEDEYEIVCVDDGSDDDSSSILQEYQRSHPNTIHIFRQSHSGVAAARNQGMAVANGDIIAFCDSDDYLIEGAYGMLLDKFWDAQTDVLTFSSVTVDRYAAARLDTFDRLDGEVVCQGSGWQYYQERGYRQFCWNHLFRKEFLDKHQITFADRRIGEDVQFCLDVHKHDPRMKQVSCCLYRYVVNEGQMMARRDPALMSCVVKDYLELFASFHQLGLNGYIQRELVPMTSRMLSARLGKNDYVTTRSKLYQMSALPMRNEGTISRLINLLYSSYLLYRIACFLHRSFFVPFILPKMHRNAGI